MSAVGIGPLHRSPLARGVTLTLAGLAMCACIDGPTGRVVDARAVDMWSAHLGDGAAPLDVTVLDASRLDASRLDAGPIADSSPRDGHPRDVRRPDSRPVDAIADAAADAGVLDADIPDLYPFTPDPVCAELTPLEIDMPGTFERVPSMPGVLMRVVDFDEDGRVELLVFDAFGPEPASVYYNHVWTRYAWDPDAGFIERGRFLGHQPMVPLTLESGRPSSSGAPRTKIHGTSSARSAVPGAGTRRWATSTATVGWSS